jgi:hypothetical protein
VLVYTALWATTLAYAQSNGETKCAAGGFDTRPWLEDFAQLTSEMSAHYADLEYAIQGRHMDLPKLRSETEAEIRASCNEGDAKQALRLFLKSFGDGHLAVFWPQPSTQPKDENPAGTASVCSRLGYGKQKLRPGIEFSLLPQFTAVGGEGAEWFPGGILRVSENKKLGVIRIPIFGDTWFPDACEQVTREMHLAPTDSCDKNCESKIKHETVNLLTVTVVKRSGELQKAGASAILVDITHNDGGGDWVDQAVRSLSATPLWEQPWGFIKHEHWTEIFEERLGDVEADLKNGKQPQDLLRQAEARLQSAIALSQEKCDRSSVWAEGKLTCPLVVSGLFYSSRVLPYAKPGSFADLQSRYALFRPLDYAYTESSARPSLYVVVDGQTWSSAEYFAFLLQDNNAAVILGEVTGGAGCGFTDGGIPTTLKNSHAVVKMPDCVHFRKDGSNANAGVTPDVLVPWSGHDNSYLRAEKLLHSLASLAGPQSKQASHEAH